MSSSIKKKFYEDLSLKVKLKLWELEKNILYYLPKSIAHQWYYKRRTGKKLNLQNPQNFNEKLQWLIINCYGKNEAKYADKLLVREYVREKGFGNILPKIYGVYKSSKEIDYEKLPMKFVLKTNHASGDDFYVICNDKENLDKKKVGRKLDKALKYNYAKKSLEYHYSYINRRIFSEELIETDSVEGLMDYKVFCFHGKAEYILVTSNRSNYLKRHYYDVNWNKVDLLKEQYSTEEKINKPKRLKEMLHIAEKLSSPFVFARIDFYNVNGKIYFGEITLTPATGINQTYSDNGLEVLGNKLDLSKVKH